MYVLRDMTLKNEVLEEAHESKLVIHPRNTKSSIGGQIWKKKIVEYVTKCGVCQ
jgi:hypothetical protein